MPIYRVPIDEVESTVVGLERQGDIIVSVSAVGDEALILTRPNEHRIEYRSLGPETAA